MGGHHTADGRALEFSSLISYGSAVYPFPVGLLVSDLLPSPIVL